MMFFDGDDALSRLIQTALAEDIGSGDVTSNATIPEAAEAEMQLVAREPLVLAGIALAGRVFGAVYASLDYLPQAEDGSQMQAGQVLASISGNARSLLAAERTALNLLQRMCGIASETAKYVEAVRETHCQILDTRKTAPGLRAIDKYAVKCGGGKNHRIGLYDMVLIKDNHIAVAGSVTQAVLTAKEHAPQGMRIEVECDTLAQVAEALDAGAEMLLLDNMSLEQMGEAAVMAKGKATCEASGNMSLARVAKVAATGVDYISVGALTHSVRAADIGLDSL
jgi:nicotinate-nucleotide pyrophosphorylase (carboxylating)